MLAYEQSHIPGLYKLYIDLDQFEVRNVFRETLNESPDNLRGQGNREKLVELLEYALANRKSGELLDGLVEKFPDTKAAIETLLRPEPQPIPPTPTNPARLRAGLSSKIGSVHLHIDGGGNRGLADRMMRFLDPKWTASEVVLVDQFARGSQRDDGTFADVYSTHTPMLDKREALQYFTTTILYEGDNGGDDTDKRSSIDDADLAEIEDKITRTLGKLTIETLKDEMEDGSVVVEAEMPVGLISDTRSEWREPVFTRQPFGGMFPFVSQNGDQDLYELHIGVDIARNGNEAPIGVEELVVLTESIGISIGGWFRFSDSKRWAYRSNMFSDGIDKERAQEIHRDFTAAIIARGIRDASVKLLVEKSLGIWRNPFEKLDSEALTLPEFIKWEQAVPKNSEFQVVSGNFLGDQSTELMDVMRRNVLKGVIYSYFLRSFADLVRWLRFREDFIRRYGVGRKELNAYVFEFFSPTTWEDDLDCFLSRSSTGVVEGYRASRDERTGKMIVASKMDDARMKRVENLLQRFVDSDKIISGRRIAQSLGFDAALIWIEMEPASNAKSGCQWTDQEWSTLDQDFAAEISRLDGEAIISNESRYMIILRKDRIRSSDKSDLRSSDQAKTVYRAFRLARRLCQILSKGNIADDRYPLSYKIVIGYDTFSPIYRSSGSGLTSPFTQFLRKNARDVPGKVNYVAEAIWSQIEVCTGLAQFDDEPVTIGGTTRFRRFDWIKARTGGLTG